MCIRDRAALAEGARSLVVEVGDYGDDQETVIWFSYAVGLANWAKESGAINSAPLGPLVPSFEGELAARRTLITIWREMQEKKPRTQAYMDALMRIEAAGYLREYVWTVHWRSSWKQPPAGLRIAEFYAWQREALVGHDPRTRSRVRVVAAPPEAAETAASAASR